MNAYFFIGDVATYATSTAQTSARTVRPVYDKCNSEPTMGGF